MVPLPYQVLESAVSLICARGPFWERPVDTLFALYGGGGWQYGLGPDKGFVVASSGAKHLSCIVQNTIYYTYTHIRTLTYPFWLKPFWLK